MSRILFPNLEFDDELSGRMTGGLPKTARAVVDSLRPTMALLGEPEDILLLPDEFRPPGDTADQTNASPIRSFQVRYAFEGEASDLLAAQSSPPQLLPWGWNRSSRRLAAELRLPTRTPPPAAGSVHTREFLKDIDVICPLAGDETDAAFDVMESERVSFGEFCSGEDTVRRALTALGECGFREAVLKANISGSGRDQRVVKDDTRENRDWNWIRRRISEGGVYVEPRVDVIEECGMQFEITEGGEITFCGVTGLRSLPTRGYLASVIRSDDVFDQRWKTAIACGFDVCRKIHQTGWFGPVGIDAMVFRDPHQRMFLRPVHDINARLTMGRLALALRGWVKAGTAGEWYPSLAPGTTDASQIAILRLAEMRRVAAVISGVCVVDVIGKHFSGSVEPVVLSRSLLVTADCG